MDVSFEFIPEEYEGNYPYIVLRIKQSQLTPNLRSRIEEILNKLHIEVVVSTALKREG